jgi:hypothetical protein
MRMCSWCKRVRESQDSWVDIEKAAASPALFEQQNPPDTTHGVRHDCEGVLLKEIGMAQGAD